MSQAKLSVVLTLAFIAACGSADSTPEITNVVVEGGERLYARMVAPVVLRIAGTNVSASTVVLLDGAITRTRFESPLLILEFQDGDPHLLSPGSIALQLRNPDGRISAVTTLPVNPTPAPTVSALDPLAVVRGHADVTLTVTGSGFTRDTTVDIEGSALQVMARTLHTLSVSVPAATFLQVGDRQVHVVIPGPGGGSSSASLPVTCFDLVSSRSLPNYLWASTLPMAVDASGRVFVAWNDFSPTYNLRTQVGVFEGGTWSQLAALDSGPLYDGDGVVGALALELDSQGRPVVAHEKRVATPIGGGTVSLSSVLGVARWNGSEWLPIGGDVGRLWMEGLSLALDPAGQPVVVYPTAGSDGTGLRSVRWDGNVWSGSRVVDAMAIEPVVTFDGSGSQVVVWEDQGTEMDGEPNYRPLVRVLSIPPRDLGSPANYTELDATTPAIALDPDGRLLLAWGGGASTRVDARESAGWTQVGDVVDGAITPGGLLRIGARMALVTLANQSSVGIHELDGPGWMERCVLRPALFNPSYRLVLQSSARVDAAGDYLVALLVATGLDDEMPPTLLLMRAPR